MMDDYRCQRCNSTWSGESKVCATCATWEKNAETPMGILGVDNRPVGHIEGPLFTVNDVGLQVALFMEKGCVVLSKDGKAPWKRVFEVSDAQPHGNVLRNWQRDVFPSVIRGKVTLVEENKLDITDDGGVKHYLPNLRMRALTLAQTPMLDPDDFDMDGAMAVDPPAAEALRPVGGGRNTVAGPEAAMAVAPPAAAASPLRPVDVGGGRNRATVTGPEDGAMAVDSPAAAAAPRTKAARRAPAGTNEADDLAQAFAAQVVPLIWTGKSGWEYEANLTKLLSGHFDTSFPGPPIRVTPTLLDDLERHKAGWTVYHHREAKSRERLKAIFSKLIKHRDVVSGVLQALVR